MERPPKIRKAPAGYCNDCFVPGNGVTVTLCEYHASVEEMRALLKLVMDDDDTRALYAEEWQALLAKVDKGSPPSRLRRRRSSP